MKVALPTYGATTTTFTSTTISLSYGQASFTILYPPPNTLPLQFTTVSSQPNLVATHKPTVLPVLVLTDVVGIAVGPNSVPIATRTLSQTPPPQATNTSATTAAAAGCPGWSCWSISKKALVGTAIGVGALLVAILLWWFFFWRPRIKKIRITVGRPPPPDLESGRRQTNIKIHSRIRTPKRRRSRSVSAGPPLASGGRSEGVRVVASNPAVQIPNVASYRVVRPQSERPQSEMPRSGATSGLPSAAVLPDSYESICSSDMSTLPDIVRPPDTDLPRTSGRYSGAGVAAAGIGRVGAAAAWSRRDSVRATRGSQEAKTSRPAAMRSGRGPENEEDSSKEIRRPRRKQSRRVKDEDDIEGQRRSQSRRDREDRGMGRGGVRVRRGREDEDDIEDRRRRRSYDARDEDEFEVRRDHSPRRVRSLSRDGSLEIESSRRDRERRRPRSVSPRPQERSKDKKKEPRKSESGGWHKYLPLLPLVFGLVHTYAEPDGGWEQFIPEEKRKGKGKLKQLAEEQFDKHHKKIPMSFRRHDNATRSKSSDRAYDSTRRRDSNREERDGKRTRSIRPPTYSPAREPFSSTAPEPGSTLSPSPSPPPRRRQSTRDHERRRSGRHGFDGADDDGYVDYARDGDTSSLSRGSRVSVGYKEPVPKNMAFHHHQPVKTPSPLGPGLEHKLRHIPTLLKPPTPPDSDHAISIL
ncbi:uncharacterized protein L3040_006687 [Drepanopeziza brunnea f. sp. 'multigermtubi']|uniref:uncharacterized protein n=1 Tax=Drepanopeziza brunnea f. sp. 'multigermtubi' TaxID=698441 RepID=UPI0023A052EB|nr:hypothetical protein L3040_006687 [Drepanopeziza brunnea f. sp. 'multigermtubi']